MTRLVEQRREPVETVSEARKRLWDAINEYCRQNGGAVVSVPGQRVMRIHCSKDSPLPAKLTQAGHDVRQGGMLTRIDGGKFLSVIEIEVVLPGK